VTEQVAVAIVGGGPSGLTAAAELASTVEGEVLVIEREAAAGGIPRHSDHPGYGMRDLRRFISGPAYAKKLTERALDAGARLETSAMVTGWADERTLEVTSPRGRRRVRADALILATGARERPRPARRIPGDRPAGVFTTGQLQNQVHLQHRDVGHRAVVVGAELVSWSAVMTLREAGCRTVLMTTRYQKSESYAAFRLGGKLAFRTPVAANTRLVRINGHGRVESVEVENTDTGERRVIECDTVITTGDWIPDHELVRTGGLELDRGTLGPRVDTSLTTSRPGVFAVGNLLHPVDTADVAALDGRHVAPYVRQFLDDRAGHLPGYELVAEAPFRWVAPQIVRTGGPAPSRSRLLLWCDEFHNLPIVKARQGGKEIGSVRVSWPAAPGRVFRVPFTLVGNADPDAGPVTLGF
jgi:thioredoxin reductase